MYKSTTGIFKDLTDEEEKEFIKYADEHEPDLSKKGLYHPVIINRWREILAKPMFQLFIDTRTDEVVSQVPLTEIKYFKPYKEN